MAATLMNVVIFLSNLDHKNINFRAHISVSVFVDADLGLVVTDLASDLGVLATELALLFQELCAYNHLQSLDELELILRLQDVRANLSDVDSLVIIEGQLLSHARRGDTKFFAAGLAHSVDEAFLIGYKHAQPMKLYKFWRLVRHRVMPKLPCKS